MVRRTIRLAKKCYHTVKTGGFRALTSKAYRRILRMFVQEQQYSLWIKQNEKNLTQMQYLEYKPLISVVVPVYNVESVFLKDCINSVRKQTYKNWELILVDDHSTMKNVRKVLKKYESEKKIKVIYRKENGHISKCTNTGLQAAKGEFVGFLDCDDILSVNALYEVVKMLNSNKKLDFIYSDEDHLSENGKIRKDVFFKPDWSPDTFMSLMYTCHFSVYRRTLLKELGGTREGYEGSQDYDLVLRLMEKTDRIGHIPKVLYHWRERKQSTASDLTAKPYFRVTTEKAKMDALKRRNLKGHLEWVAITNQYRVVYEPQSKAMVSIVIPSKDNVSMLRKCLENIYTITEYDNFEVVVVDNGSSEENRQKVQVLSGEYGFAYIYRPMEFNFSAMCNLGAQAAKGEFILFMNDDVEVKGGQWLSRMLGHCELPHIGAVGCKLYYPGEKKIQHVGVLNLPIGPGHAFHQFEDKNNIVCYYGRNLLEYNYSVVTGACMMVEKKKFDEVGGFDESLAIAYNDVELCFKLLKKGYYNVVRMDVVLIHHESVSRGEDEQDAEKRKRQMKEMQHLYELHPDMKGYDPCYNVNLAPDRGDYSLNYKTN